MCGATGAIHENRIRVMDSLFLEISGISETRSDLEIT